MIAKRTVFYVVTNSLIQYMITNQIEVTRLALKVLRRLPRMMSSSSVVATCRWSPVVALDKPTISARRENLGWLVSRSIV